MNAASDNVFHPIPVREMLSTFWRVSERASEPTWRWSPGSGSQAVAGPGLRMLRAGAIVHLPPRGDIPCSLPSSSPDLWV